MFQVEAAVSNSQSSVVEASKARVPVSIWSVLRHMPVEIWRPVAPPHGTALAKRLLDLVHRPMRRCFGVRIGRFPGAAHRPASCHQPTDEIGSLNVVETGIRHAIRQSLPRTTK